MKTEVGGTFEWIKRRLDPGMRCGRGRGARGDFFWGEALKRRKILGLRMLGVWESEGHGRVEWSFTVSDTKVCAGMWATGSPKPPIEERKWG